MRPRGDRWFGHGSILKSPLSAASGWRIFRLAAKRRGLFLRMDLPKLSPANVSPRAPRLAALDALLLARLGEREKAAHRTTAIITADATDAQRLIDEMAFSPRTALRLFPDWETLPYDQFSRTRI